MNQKIRIDDEFKSLIPPLSHDEFIGLEQSLLSEGCRDAIVLWNDTVIDGHNRFQICQKHGIKFSTVSREFDDRTEAKIWIIKNQFNRRNLSDYVRVTLALKLKSFFTEKAKENQAQKNKWIDNARLSLEKTERQNCFVCGDYKPFCQAHHLIPLSEQYDMGFKEPDNSHIWLCPTHHIIIHTFMNGIKNHYDENCEQIKWITSSESSHKYYQILKMYLKLKGYDNENF